MPISVTWHTNNKMPVNFDENVVSVCRGWIFRVFRLNSATVRANRFIVEPSPSRPHQLLGAGRDPVQWDGNSCQQCRANEKIECQVKICMEILLCYPKSGNCLSQCWSYCSVIPSLKVHRRSIRNRNGDSGDPASAGVHRLPAGQSWVPGEPAPARERIG